MAPGIETKDMEPYENVQFEDPTALEAILYFGQTLIDTMKLPVEVPDPETELALFVEKFFYMYSKVYHDHQAEEEGVDGDDARVFTAFYNARLQVNDGLKAEIDAGMRYFFYLEDKFWRQPLKDVGATNKDLLHVGGYKPVLTVGELIADLLAGDDDDDDGFDTECV